MWTENSEGRDEKQVFAAGSRAERCRGREANRKRLCTLITGREREGEGGDEEFGKGKKKRRRRKLMAAQCDRARQLASSHERGHGHRDERDEHRCTVAARRRSGPVQRHLDHGRRTGRVDRVRHNELVALKSEEDRQRQTAARVQRSVSQRAHERTSVGRAAIGRDAGPLPFSPPRPPCPVLSVLFQFLTVSLCISAMNLTLTAPNGCASAAVAFRRVNVMWMSPEILERQE